MNLEGSRLPTSKRRYQAFWSFFSFFLSAQAGYIVTLQQVGPNVVATGSGAFKIASSGSGNMVGIGGGQHTLIVSRGYVSGTFLSGSATYSGKTLATLGVTPGTYVWTRATGANQNFTLQIEPATNITNISTRASVQTGQNVMMAQL